MDDTAPEQIHGLLMEVIRAVGLLQPDQVAPGFPLSLSQSFALHDLDTDPPLSQRELAERLRLEKSSVSRMVADMERKELLVRERDPANRRSYRLTLTDRGRELHRHMAAAFHPHHVRWMESMTPEERQGLLTGLPALIRVIRDDTAPPDQC